MTGSWYLKPYHLGPWTLKVWIQDFGLAAKGLLGGSWVVISGVISRATKVITHIRGLITPLITTPKPQKPYRTL